VILFLLYQWSYFWIWQINSEIHISEKALVVVVAFFLSVCNVEIVEGLVVNLTHVFKSFIITSLFMTCCHMNIDESKWSFIEIKTKSNRSFVSCYAWKSCLHFGFSKLSKSILMVQLCKHDDVATNHELLSDWNILDTEWVIIERIWQNWFPNCCSWLVFTRHDLFCIESNHFLQAHYNYVRHLIYGKIIIILVNLLVYVKVIWRCLARTVPRNHRHLQIRLFSIHFLILHHFSLQVTRYGIGFWRRGCSPVINCKH